MSNGQVVPLSPVAANLYIENFEKVAIDPFDYKPKWWFLYVDDTLIWPQDINTLTTFFWTIKQSSS